MKFHEYICSKNTPPTYIHIYIHEPLYIYTYMCVCVCVYIYIYNVLYIYIYTHTHTHTNTYIYIMRDNMCASICVWICLHKWVECWPMVREIGAQSQVGLYQRLKKWYLIPPWLTHRIIRYVSRVKWGNPGKGVAPSLTPRCSSYWKGSLRVALN